MAFGLVGATILWNSPARGGESTENLIKQLGSLRFQDREAATTALRGRPDAAAALRAATLSSDREVVRRATEVLAYFDREPVRKLEKTIKEGYVDRAIDIISRWPENKYNGELISSVYGLSLHLRDLHHKKGLPLNLWVIARDIFARPGAPSLFRDPGR
jgi:hypothetical protein